MKLVNYLLGVILVLALTVITILMAGNSLLSYVDFLSLLIVILFPLPTMLGLFGWQKFRFSMGLAFKKETAEPEDYRNAAVVVRALGRMIYLSALLGFFIGFIGILASIGTSEQLAANLGVALVVTFYGILLNLVVIEPIHSYLKARS